MILREASSTLKVQMQFFFDVIGGRVTPGERFEDCLRRKVKEGAELDVKIGQPFFIGGWWPVVKGEPWQVIGIYFECFSTSYNVVFVNDHDEYKWIDPKHFMEENLIPSFRLVFKAYSKRDTSSVVASE